MSRIVGRWWNGRWGRTSRKDIWIEQRGDIVLLRWAQGGHEREREAADLERAQAAAQGLRDHGDPYDQWHDWTDLYR